MRLFLILICLAMLLGRAVLAQTTTLPVRAGEHADFTRVVIQIPDANHWRVTAEARRARLDVTGPPLRFDLRQTFSKIPRTRLRSAQAGPDWLELELACDCEVDASEDIPGFLIIDLRGTPSRVRPASSARVRPKARPTDLLPSPPPDSAAAQRAGRDLARLTREGTLPQPGKTSLTLDTLFAPVSNALTMPRASPSGAAADRVTITQELARMLSGAVAQGILHGDENYQPQDREREPMPETLSSDLASHMRLTTPSLPGVEHVSDPAAPSLRCHEAVSIDMSLWDIDLTEARSDISLGHLFGEFDRLDTEAAIAVARSFIALGFGAEARMIIDLLQDHTLEHHLLTRLAHLVDLEMQEPLAELKQLRECNAFAYLWAYLDSARDRPLPALRGDLLFHAVSQLPPNLRLHLGPEVIQRLTLQGERAIAQSIRATIDRVTGETPPSLELARAALDLPQAPAAEAARLEAKLDPERSDDALLFLLAQREEQDAPLEERLQSLAEDRLLALRNTTEGRRLARLLLRAAMRDGEFAEAVTLFEEQKSYLGEEQLAAMADLLEGLVTQADDLSFVTLTFRIAPWEIPALHHDLRAQLAARMEGLGFLDQARLLREAASPDLSDAPQSVPDAPEQNAQTPETGPVALDLMEDATRGTAEISSMAVSAEGETPPVAMQDRSDRLMAPVRPAAEQTAAPFGSTAENQTNLGEGQSLAQDLMQVDVSLAAPIPEPAATGPQAPVLASQNSAERASDQDPGLLTLGRDTLEQSVALRETVRAFLESDDPP